MSHSPGAEDDGYIVTFLVDGKAGDSELLVLDAAQVARGPIARIPIGTNIAHGQRGCWAAAPDLPVFIVDTVHVC